MLYFLTLYQKYLTGIRVAVGMCWGTLVAAEFLAGTTGIGFVENVAREILCNMKSFGSPFL